MSAKCINVRLYLNKTEQVCDKTIYSKNTLSANLEMILSVLSNKGKALIIIKEDVKSVMNLDVINSGVMRSSAGDRVELFTGSSVHSKLSATKQATTPSVKYTSY